MPKETFTFFLPGNLSSFETLASSWAGHLLLQLLFQRWTYSMDYVFLVSKITSQV